MALTPAWGGPRPLPRPPSPEISILPVKLRVRALWPNLGDSTLYTLSVRGLCSDWSDR